MANLKVGDVFEQSWIGGVNPMRFEVLEIDRSRDYLRVKCIGCNGYSHEEEWEGHGDGLTFTENCINMGEYRLIDKE
jgi:hypothetical protein